MKTLTILTATALTALSMATQAAFYTTTGTTGSVSVDAGATVSLYYTGATDGSSNTGYAAIDAAFDGDWTFDFSDLNNVAFTGNIHLGDYEMQTNITGFPTIDGHMQYNNENHALSGVASYDEGTNTLSYNFLNGTVNGGGGSVATTDSPTTCVNGKKSVFGTVCGGSDEASVDWEGLAFNLVFSEDRSTFAGQISGTSTSGKGLTANTTVSNFNVAGEVPVPAAAWLFGSALMGLAGIKRRK